MMYLSPIALIMYLLPPFQTVGCVFTLYAISPKLTMLMVTVIPAIIGVGTLMGSGLRALSKAAQDQVNPLRSQLNEHAMKLKLWSLLYGQLFSKF